MRITKIIGDGLAILAVIIALTGVILSMIGLESRDWHWSNAMLLFALVNAGGTVFCIALTFRDPSRTSLVNTSFVLIGLNLLLFVVFDRNPLEF